MLKISFLIILCQFSIFSQKDENSIKEFRGIKWGMSPAHVKEREKAEYLQQSKGFGFSSLSYKGNIAGLPARIDYTFRNDSLVEGSYSIQKIDSFFKSISDVRNFLTDLYSKPDYANVNALYSDSVWTVENPGILYNGPQYFWEFRNGFICLYSSKFVSSNSSEEIDITVLHVPYTKILEYTDSRLIPLDSLNFPKKLWNGANP